MVCQHFVHRGKSSEIVACIGVLGNGGVGTQSNGLRDIFTTPQAMCI
jgi:hypothetical protein